MAEGGGGGAVIFSTCTTFRSCSYLIIADIIHKPCWQKNQVVEPIARPR